MVTGEQCTHKHVQTDFTSSSSQPCEAGSSPPHLHFQGQTPLQRRRLRLGQGFPRLCTVPAALHRCVAWGPEGPAQAKAASRAEVRVPGGWSRGSALGPCQSLRKTERWVGSKAETSQNTSAKATPLTSPAGVLGCKPSGRGLGPGRGRQGLGELGSHDASGRVSGLCARLFHGPPPAQANVIVSTLHRRTGRL